MRSAFFEGGYTEGVGQRIALLCRATGYCVTTRGRFQSRDLGGQKHVGIEARPPSTASDPLGDRGPPVTAGIADRMLRGVRIVVPSFARTDQVTIFTAMLVVPLSVVTGAALAVAPLLAVLPIVGLAIIPLLLDGRARILFVVFGGMFVLQRSSEFDMLKVGFLALFAVAFVGAFVNVRQMWSTPAYQLARPLLIGSTAFAVLAALSLFVAYKNGTPVVGGWLRDIAPYLLFASAPVFALDAQAWLSRRSLEVLILAAGIVAAFAFAAYWLNARNILDLQASRIGLASLFVPAALFAYGMSAVLHARRLMWLAVSAFVLALLLVTGTRTNLVLLIAPLAIALSARQYRLARSIRLAVLGPIAVAATLVFGLAIVNVSDASRDDLGVRIALLRETGGASDDSFSERYLQAQVAWRTFKSSPVVGAGPGVPFKWRTIDRTAASTSTLDTATTFPAKFGLVGLFVLAIIIATYWSFAKALVRRNGPTVEYLALVGYLAVAVAVTIGYSPFEDKGFSFGLVLILALALSGVDRRNSGVRALQPGERSWAA